MGREVTSVRRIERRAEREAVVLPAKVRSRSGFLDRVTIVDLSEWGCQVQSRALTLHKDDLVVVRPEGVEGLCGRVCWVSGHAAGIAFDRPMYAPVVEHLCRLHRDFSAAIAAPPAPQLRLVA